MDTNDTARAYLNGTEQTPFEHFKTAQIGETSGPTAELYDRDGYQLSLTPIEGRTALDLSVSDDAGSLTFIDDQVVVLSATLLGMLSTEARGPADRHISKALAHLRKAIDLNEGAVVRIRHWDTSIAGKPS